MSPELTETPTTESQEQEVLHQWTTPSFESVPLNEALWGGFNADDGDGPSS